MATADVALSIEPTTLYYYLEVKDGGIIQTYPGTAFEKRRKHVPHDVNISDIRSVTDQFTIEKNGFQLVNNPTEEKDFLDEEQVRNIYYPQCKALVKKLTGASDVHIVSHMTRRHRFDEAQNDALNKNDKEFVTKNNPARFCHVDQSLHGAIQFLYLNLDSAEADHRTKSRWAIMNIWQPITNPVHRDALAFCDYRTINHDDFRPVIANLPPPGTGEYANVSKNMTHHNNKQQQQQEAKDSCNGEQRGARYEVANLAYNPDQKWYFASEMTTEEAWVFKIFDSKKDGRARCAAHSSFPLKGQKDEGVPRRSIEVRCFVFWEGEEVD